MYNVENRGSKGFRFDGIMAGFSEVFNFSQTMVSFAGEQKIRAACEKTRSTSATIEQVLIFKLSPQRSISSRLSLCGFFFFLTPEVFLPDQRESSHIIRPLSH